MIFIIWLTVPVAGKHLYTPIRGQEDAYDFLLTADNFLYANNGKPVVNGDTSFLSRNMNRTDNYQMNFTVTYNRTFGDHTLGIVLYRTFGS